MNPNNNNQLFAATNKGIYKTDNAEETNPTWAIFQLGGTTIFDIEFKPNDPNILYASSRNAIYRFSYSSGNWASGAYTLPVGTRIELAVMPNATGDNAKRLYAIVAGGTTEAASKGLYGVYMTTDATTTTFSLTKIYGNTGQSNLLANDYNSPYGSNAGQGHYNLAIAVDPNNVNSIYVGGVNLYRLQYSATSTTVKLISYLHNTTLSNLPSGKLYSTVAGQIKNTSPQYYRAGFNQTNSNCVPNTVLSRYQKVVFQPQTNSNLTITATNPSNAFLSVYYTGYSDPTCSRFYMSASSATPSTLILPSPSTTTEYDVVITSLGTTTLPSDYQIIFNNPVKITSFSAGGDPALVGQEISVCSQYVSAYVHALVDK